MLVCTKCHQARQDRGYQAFQPLQFTQYETTQTRPAPCPDCGITFKGAMFEYVNAFYMAQELEETKDQLKNYGTHSACIVDVYDDAAEMLHAVTLGNAQHILSDPEIMLQVLQYAADCEGDGC